MSGAVPDTEPPALLPGPTADKWRSRSFRLSSAAFLVGLATIGLIATFHEGARVVAIAGAVVVMACGTGLIISGVHLNRAAAREKAAGYTTLWGSRYDSYWQLDPRTGAVIRPPVSRTKS